MIHLEGNVVPILSKSIKILFVNCSSIKHPDSLNFPNQTFGYFKLRIQLFPHDLYDLVGLFLLLLCTWSADAAAFVQL